MAVLVWKDIFSLAKPAALNTYSDCLKKSPKMLDTNAYLGSFESSSVLSKDASHNVSLQVRKIFL